MSTDVTGAPSAMPLGELLGITVLRDEPDDAVCRLEITTSHLNQGMLAHGGALFTLADTALGLAANQPGAPTWVGTSFTMSLYRGLQVGDVVLARAALENRSRSLAGYRVVLEREDDERLIGTLTAQLLTAPSIAGRPAELSAQRVDAAAPLVRALLAARSREGDAPGDGPDQLFVLYADGRPVGLAVGDEGAWLHPAWRDVVTDDDARDALRAGRVGS